MQHQSAEKEPVLTFYPLCAAIKTPVYKSRNVACYLFTFFQCAIKSILNLADFYERTVTQKHWKKHNLGGSREEKKLKVSIVFGVQN